MDTIKALEKHKENVDALIHQIKNLEKINALVAGKPVKIKVKANGNGSEKPEVKLKSTARRGLRGKYEKLLERFSPSDQEGIEDLYKAKGMKEAIKRMEKALPEIEKES